MLDDAEKRLLHDPLRVMPAAHDPRRHAVHPPLVLGDQRLERGEIARAGRRDGLLVRVVRHRVLYLINRKQNG